MVVSRLRAGLPVARALPRRYFGKAADFDSAIPRFESWRPSQILSNDMRDIDALARRLGDLFMLHRVAEIYMCFQGLPFAVGDSTQHGCNMLTTCWTCQSARALPTPALISYRLPHFLRPSLLSDQ